MEKKGEQGEERLNKIIAMAGITSRRSADGLISAGRVIVNGRVITKPGSKAIWRTDSITVDGSRIPGPPENIYIILNKPFGYVSTLKDPEGRPIISDLIKDIKERVYPVGRLDFDSQGLLILTNNGDLAFRLMHPRFHIPRTYKVTVDGNVTTQSVKRLKKGVFLGDGLTHPAVVKIINREKDRTVLRLTMFEGRSREIRRMFEAVGHKTIKLIRTGYGDLVLGNLKVGKYRHLTNAEVTILYASVGLG